MFAFRLRGEEGGCISLVKNARRKINCTNEKGPLGVKGPSSDRIVNTHDGRGHLSSRARFSREPLQFAFSPFCPLRKRINAKTHPEGCRLVPTTRKKLTLPASNLRHSRYQNF